MIWSDSASAPWQRRQTKDTAWTDGQFVFEAKVHNISNTLSDRNRESSERLQKELADVTAQPQFKNLQAAHTIKKPVFDVQDSLCNQLKRIGDDVFSRRRHRFSVESSCFCMAGVACACPESSLFLSIQLVQEDRAEPGHGMSQVCGLFSIQCAVRLEILEQRPQVPAGSRHV